MSKSQNPTVTYSRSPVDSKIRRLLKTPISDSEELSAKKGKRVAQRLYLKVF